MNYCKRCGKEYSNPYPEIKVSDADTQIATVEWCAECNEFVMDVLLRERSAYRSPKILRKECDY